MVLLGFKWSQKQNRQTHSALCRFPGSFFAGWVVVGDSVRPGQRGPKWKSVIGRDLLDKLCPSGFFGFLAVKTLIHEHEPGVG